MGFSQPVTKSRLPYNAYVAKERQKKAFDAKNKLTKWKREKNRIVREEKKAEESGDVGKTAIVDQEFEDNLAFPALPKKETVDSSVKSSVKSKKRKHEEISGEASGEISGESAEVAGQAEGQAAGQIEGTEGKTEAGASWKDDDTTEYYRKAGKRIKKKVIHNTSNNRYSKEFAKVREQQGVAKQERLQKQKEMEEREEKKKEFAKKRQVQGKLRGSKNSRGQPKMSDMLEALLMKHK